MEIKRYDIVECEGEEAVVLDVWEPAREFETDEKVRGPNNPMADRTIQG